MTKAERETLKAEYITGDYRTLKEFAEKKGLCYQDVKNYAYIEKWNAAKVEHNKRVADEILTASKEKCIEEGLRNLEQRQDKNLELISDIKSQIAKKIAKADAKELNALSSALYRCAEIESNILGLSFGDDGDTVVNISIQDCTKDGDKQ